MKPGGGASGVVLREEDPTAAEGEGVRQDRTLAEVRRFWDANPLFAGESRHEPGEPAFFEEHARMTMREHSGRLAQVFVRDARAGVRLLDVGCGIGFWIQALGERGADVTACDLSGTAVRLARRRAGHCGLVVRIAQANGESLPFAPASFDHVNCQGVIHHTPRPRACLEEFRRVLEPGGTLCFSVYLRNLPLRSRLLFRLVVAAGKRWIRLPGRGRERMWDASDPEELVRLYDGADNPLGRAFTRREVSAMLGSGWDVLEVRRFGFPRRILPFDLSDRVHRLLSRLFGLMIVYRCRKKD